MRQAKVLLIDDEEACLFSVKLMLESLDLSVMLARSGAEAFEVLKKNRSEISVILLDMMLPDITGLEILKEISREPSYAEIPVIIQTGMSDADNSLVEVKKMGIAGILKKPYNLDEIEKQVSSVIKS